MKTIFCFLSNQLLNVGKTSSSLGGIPKRSVLVELLNVWLGDHYHSLRLNLPCLHPESEIKNAEGFSRRLSFQFVSNGCRNISFAVFRLLFGVCGHSTVSYCNSEFLKLFGCVNNSFNKLLLILTVLRGYINSSETGSTRTKRTKKQHHVPLSFVAVKDSYRYKGQGKNKKQSSRDKNFLENTLFHLSSLRELISDLSLATKFYSFPRRPNFLGLLVSKSRQAHTPRLSDSFEGLSALIMFLNTEPVTRLLGLFDLSKYNSSIFRTLSGYPAALLFIPDRRLYE